METNVIKSVSLAKAVTSGLVRNISKVRQNSNGYPYVTMLNGDKASNVYFGKKSAQGVNVGDVLTSEQLQKAQVILATNESGEQRLKLSFGGESEYTDLSTVFGDVAPQPAEEIEVLKTLATSMVAKEEVTPPAISA